jgi:hydrocephalus-inducing protein
MNLEVNEIDFAFKDDYFRIEPKSGILWPGSTIDINVFFRPMKVGDFNAIAYCEVEGRESRLPFQLKGTSIGPKVKFSHTAFRIGEIFINTSHKYEVRIIIFLILDYVGKYWGY